MNRSMHHLVITLASIALLGLAFSSAIAAEEQKAEPTPAKEQAAPAKPETAKKAAETPKPAAEAAKPAAETKKTSPTDKLAKVGDTVITRVDVERAAKAMLTQNRNIQNITPDILKQAEEAALEQLIAAEILYQAGSKKEIKDLDKQIEEKFNQSKSRFKTPEEFSNALKSADLTEADLKLLNRKDVVITNLVEKDIAAKITVSDDEIKKFYNDNLERFKQPEQVRASHILIGLNAGASDEDKQKAKAKIDDLLKKAKAGEDFAKLAKENSTCPSSAQGGDLGLFGKGQMVKPFEDVAFGLKPGEMSGVVETQFGYHIIKLTEKNEATTTPLSEVKERISDYLKQQKLQKAVFEYVEAQRATIKVERFTN